MKKLESQFIITAVILFMLSCNTNHLPVYKEPAAKTEDRVKDLLARMTLEEKIAQLTPERGMAKKWYSSISGINTVQLPGL